MGSGAGQEGATLIEVMVALLVLGVGVLGASLLQLNALKHSHSAMRSTQVSFVAQDLLERARANPDGHYALASLSQAPVTASPENPRDQDLFDFADQLRRMAGSDVQASIAVAGSRVTVTVDWNDSRAQGTEAYTRTLTMSSLIRPMGGTPP
jgi:type IV pilus assembly protein PilV